MAMILKSVHPGRGAHWVRDGLRLYMQRPLAFTGLYAACMFAVIIAAQVPLAGSLLLAMLAPLISLGMMVASQSALLGGAVGLGQVVEPFRGTATARRSLLLLCFIYGAAVLATFWFGDVIADGGIGKLAALMRPDAPAAEVEALLAGRALTAGVLFIGIALALLSVPYWHALALVHWGGQGPWQALFSSTLALWRCRGAFVVYGLTWFGLTTAFALVSGVVLSIVGLPQLATLLAITAGLFFSTLFYVSLIFTFNDSFGPAPGSPVQSTLI
jgi:hypothetical protein